MSGTSIDDALKDAPELPDPSKLPSIRIYSHTTLFYWWPVWVAGYVMAIFSYLQGGVIELDKVRHEWFHPSSSIGLIFVVILLFVIVFTNIKMRGIYSIAFMISVALIVVTIALMGWWGEILRIIPYISIHMNMGFYLVFSTALALIWAFVFFVTDRLVYWRVRPGQLTEERILGGGEESYDARGMLFEQKGDDFFRHRVLGLGAGDLKLITSGAKKETINIPNVLFAERKVEAIQKLIMVEPGRFLAEADNDDDHDS